MATPLFGHTSPGSIVAWRAGRPITAAELLADIRAFAARLPARRYLLNLCSDRYRFFVAFAAALVRGQTNLFPPNSTEQCLADVVAAYPDCACVTEGPRPAVAIEIVEFPAAAPAVAFDVPTIDPEFPAALVFTSGSTGTPRPNLKTFGRLVAGAHAECAALGLAGRMFHLLGTVPPQHMYGFESTVFLPLAAGATMHAGRPLFPADVRAGLAEMPEPRVLVTSPVHIRACIEDGGAMPALDLVVSAAAPLPIEHARIVEERFGARLMEIYGFTEAGMVAARRSTQSAVWETLADVRLVREGFEWGFEGGHVHGRVPVTDLIAVQSPERFTLEGRPRDLVNIAGKRASLADLNHKLTSIKGVVDGVFHIPGDGAGAVARLMAFVVAPGLTEQEILKRLRRAVDPAFLPRPLVKVERLPRAETGKLPLEALRALEAAVEK